MSLIGVCSERPENVIVSKYMSTHALSEMGKYVEKLQRIIYEHKKLETWGYLSNMRVDDFFGNSISQYAGFSVLCF